MEFKHIYLTVVLALFCLSLYGQSSDEGNTLSKWSENTGQKLNVGAYGEVHYNQAFHSDVRKNGTLDVHRLVLLNAYHFSKKASFLTEIEFEHVKELAVEQAFFNYRHSGLLNFKAGLLLVPMGIVNEYHEPTTFFSVERPIIDKTIVPSTWREIGTGITGNSISTSLKYQLYFMNGFLGYDGSARLNGINGLRSGRQKGAESTMSSPTFSGKVNFYGIKGLNLGFSLYSGKSQSTLFHNLEKSDKIALAHADSSVVYINMLGLDARFDLANFHVRGQLNFVQNNNTAAYNDFAGSDLGSEMMAYYLEVAYHLLRHKDGGPKITVFSRYEYLNTHFATDELTKVNASFEKRYITTGVNWKPANGVVFKIDYQRYTSSATDLWDNFLNIGVGFWLK